MTRARASGRNCGLIQMYPSRQAESQMGDTVALVRDSLNRVLVSGELYVLLVIVSNSALGAR